MNANLDTAAAALERARQLAAAGRGEDARAEYNRVLGVQPEHAEALAFLGTHELACGNAPGAIDWLERARAGDADNPQILLGLGNAYLAGNRPEEAVDVLARCAELAPKAFLAKLLYAQALEALGREHAALVQYFRAITQAQAQGRWLSDATTAPPLRDQVKYAMGVVDAGRRRLFEGLLEPLRTKYGDAELKRVSECLHMYLGELPTHYPDARQKPKFLFFPGLPPTTYFDRALFPWYAQLEQSTDAIRAELLAVMTNREGLEPFLQVQQPEEMRGYLGGVENPVWDAYFFYRHGERFDAHHARCPRTSAALESLPTLVRIRDHAPEVCFSVLTPGTHILKHRGVTNTRLVTHLPLIIPDNCAISVGGEERAWREGECFTFDDTFEHEAWNRGERTRVVMLMDVWNPYLSEAEREAIATLIEGIGDFNQSAGIDGH
ncbi:MAG: aspartyl/asparaginyl beta-hydroxylase domain-containing protein [Rudaea sp.]